MPAGRNLVRLVAAVILLAGCGVATRTATSPTAERTATAAPGPRQSPSPTGGGYGGALGAGHPAASSRPGGGSSGGGQPSTSNPDAGALGSMSRGFLRPSPYSSVNLEIDVAGAAAPSSAVVSEMVALLGRETGKPVGQAGGQALAGPGAGCWSDSDIMALASPR